MDNQLLLLLRMKDIKSGYEDLLISPVPAPLRKEICQTIAELNRLIKSHGTVWPRA